MTPTRRAIDAGKHEEHEAKMLSRKVRIPCRRLTLPFLYRVLVLPNLPLKVRVNVPSSFSSSLAASAGAAASAAPPAAGAAAAPPPAPMLRTISFKSLPSSACNPLNPGPIPCALPDFQFVPWP